MSLRHKGLLILLAFLPLLAARADEGCAIDFAALAQAGSQVDNSRQKADLIAELRAKQIPAFLKTTPNGDLPVILLTRQTSPLLDDFLMGSMGTQSMTHDNWPNDHGSVRYQNLMIDAYVPGERPVGELNRTGISTKILNEYLEHHREISKGVIEIAYRLTPEEMRHVDYYHRVRRAAIFRIRFSLGNQSMYPQFDNLLQTTSDNCFGICKSPNLPAQIQEMKTNLQKLGVANVEQFFSEAKTKAYLAEVYRKLLTSDQFDAAHFNETLIAEGEAGRLLDEIIPAAAPAAERQHFADWVVGVHASVGYQTVMRSLNVSGDVGIADMNNPRATAILVIDNPEKAPTFFDATYQLRGHFFNLDTTGSHPLPPGN